MQQVVSSVSSVYSPGAISGDGSLPAVPLFPVGVLPGACRQLVEEGVAALGVPPEFIAVPLLTFAGAAIGNAQCIQLKQGFEQRPVIYAAVVGPPGCGKSPADDLARRPLERLQEEAKLIFEAALAQYEAAVSTNPHGPQPVRPRMEHFYSTDATTEAIAAMLVSSPGFALVRDELVGWVRSFDAYRGGRGGDRQNWLSMWSGASLKVDRKTADPIVVARPVVCVCGGVQPDMLADLADEAGRRDGFIERILWSYPDVEAPPWTEATVQPETTDGVRKVFRQLRANAGDEPIKLSTAAKGLWVPFYDQNAVLGEEATGLMAGVHAKLPNQAARLALILHCLKHPSRPESQAIDAETMDGALDLAEYFVCHARRVVPHFGTPTLARSGGLATRVLGVLAKAEGEWRKRTRLHNELGRHVAAADLTKVLSDLEEKGLVEHREVAPGPPAAVRRRSGGR